MLLPLEPARACGRFDLLHVALMADRRARSQRARLVAGKYARTKGLAQDGGALVPEHTAEGLVDERQPPFGIAAQDDIGLVVEQVAIARLVLADLPLEVLELLQAALEPVADAQEALELAAEIAIGLGRALRARGRACRRSKRSMSAASLSAGPEGIRVWTRLTHARLSLTPLGGMQPRSH